MSDLVSLGNDFGSFACACNKLSVSTCSVIKLGPSTLESTSVTPVASALHPSALPNRNRPATAQYFPDLSLLGTFTGDSLKEEVCLDPVCEEKVPPSKGGGLASNHWRGPSTTRTLGWAGLLVFYFFNWNKILSHNIFRLRFSSLPISSGPSRPSYQPNFLLSLS